MGVRYAVWNNKGGVGKTFLSFMLSSEYALAHQDKTVIAVDMCPQANLSEMLLGGNSRGAVELSELMRRKQTIGGYINSRITSPHQMTGRESEFFIHVHEYNHQVPKNVYLVAGDSQLEIQAQVINQIGGQTLPEDSWKNVHSWLLDLVIVGEQKYGNSVSFIDCNPSFSAYTELALLAATHVIVPCSSDGSSARAIDNLGALVYGWGLPRKLKSAGFFERAHRFGMKLPLVHSVLLNRSTQYDRKASKAFRAMFDEIKKRTEAFKRERPECVYKGFEYRDIPDAHSPAIVCSHQGLPISSLRPGSYSIHDITTQVNPGPLSRYKDSIEKMVESLAGNG